MRISDKAPERIVISRRRRRTWPGAMALRIAALAALGGCMAPPTVTPSSCGDGFIDELAGEECDDGGQSASCDMDCTLVVCGDGLANPAAGEQCDDGNQASGDGCSVDCRFERCGDGVVDERAGEECDDGNHVAGDGCSETCQVERCGNGRVEAGEACDDGGESARCNADCTSASCGDLVVNAAAGEACDEGGVDSATCDHDCTFPVCGDATTNPAAGEACDAGGIDTPTCNRDCQPALCGDGLVNVMAGEQCDAGGETAACDRDCTIVMCGDGLANPSAGEACDDGGASATCDADCTPAMCGDGHVNPARDESCDDGNAINGDGCSASCRLERCGNGTLDPGETCDDGNNLPGDGCSANCRSTEICGNGIVDAVSGEQCDDGGQSRNCDADCTSAGCGDFVVNPAAGEACDEGGADTATCDHDCTAPACGDFLVNPAASEQCDDGGQSASCDADCTVADCGDFVVNSAAGETCDQGGVSTPACDRDCTAPACGDFEVNPAVGEECDHGGLSTTVCDRDCTFPVCGDLVVNPAVGEACDEGNVSTATCDGNCTRPECGDGLVNAASGEECDRGGDTADCDRDCTAPACGDGLVNPWAGEQCDTGADIALCDADCTIAWCGDGYLNAARGEVCDDGNNLSGDGCSADCLSAEICGDGVVDAVSGEQCDDGGESGQCDADCTLALCGDGVLNAQAGEGCDEGGVDTATCNASCTAPACGDGHVNLAAGEDCESGGVDSLFCDGDCTFAWCGDGFVNPVVGEECDDGNATDGDGCSSTCEIASCEDGVQNGDEQGVDCGGSCVSCSTQAMIVAGGTHTCALLETGAVRCWGQGFHGQLGYGNTNEIGDDETPATAGDVNVGGPAVQVVAGEDHTCALLETGAVRCWGDNGYGQLGYGNTNSVGDDEVPAAAGDVNVGGGVVQLAAGGWHTCALLETGAVRCWGVGSAGQLGYGNTSRIGDNETPASAGDVNVGGPVVQLAAGVEHTCALLETGAVRCWGEGEAGLGYGNEDSIGDDEAPASAGDVNVGSPVVQLAAGGMHTCALLETGAVRCWGAGGSGQLGYGNTSPIGDNETPSTAGDVDVGGRVVQLTAGADHTCALLETGAVRCWGYGLAGRLGYGNTSNIGDNETPASAGDVNVGGTVAQLAAGGMHTCALLETGAVRCWGWNGQGQLGYGLPYVAIGDDETPASAGDVDVGVPCDACAETQLMVVAGYAHTCALLETGAARCWGQGSYGQLGYGNTNDIGDDEAPAAAGDVNVGGRVVQLAAGQWHTCALLETGAVRCWGDGWAGQLGYGNTITIGDNEAPATAGDVDVGGAVVQLVAGNAHTCALLETGAVRCWGDGDFGQLGYGNTNNVGDDEAPATAGDVNVGGHVEQLAAGDAHTCALLETGAVRCWGAGGTGQLGYGNTNNIGDDEIPASAGDVNMGGGVVQLTAGEYHTCALLETGAVRCWGAGGYGRLGYGNTYTIGDDEAPAMAGDVDVGGLVEQLAGGGAHTCAALETGAVRCWGLGFYGQLGYGNTSNIGDNEPPASAGDVNVGGSVVQLAAGYLHTCALLDTGAVRCWGESDSGELGYGNTNTIGDDETPASAGDVPYR